MTPRTRVARVAHLVLLPPARFAVALKSLSGLLLAELVVPWVGGTGGTVEVRLAHVDPLALALDHADMLGLAMLRSRGNLDYSDIAFALLPERLTLRALQDMHQARNKPAFRRRMFDTGKLETAGQREIGSLFYYAERFQRHQLRSIKE